LGSLRYRFPARMASVVSIPLIALIIATQSAFAGHAAKPQPVAMQQTPPKAIGDYIKHIVFIIKENRSFDNIFGAYATPQNDVNGVQYGVTPNGAVVPLSDTPDTGFDVNHGRAAAIVTLNAGALDSFGVLDRGKQSLAAYSQVKPSDDSRYWTYADNYVLADNNFSSESGPTLPNRLYSIAAQSAGVINVPTSGISWGCDDPPAVHVRIADGMDVYPCFNESQIETLAPELDRAGISWKYYYSTAPNSQIFNPFDAIRQVRCGDPQCKTPGKDWQEHMDSTNIVGFANDIANNNLPQVSWLVAPFSYSEHPPASLCQGESWTVDAINDIMETDLNPQPGQHDYWKDTAIIVDYDEWGGFYDHVQPQFIDQEGVGYRTPLLIISPYAYATDNPSHPHVTHTFYELSSVVKLIEKVFNLPLLDNGQDRDANRNLSDMTNAFNFNMSPLPALYLTPRCTINLKSPPTVTGFIDPS